MRPTMRLRWKPDPENELSFFIIAYVLAMVTLLLLVHFLQPEREGSAESSSRSPTHQDRQQKK